MKITNWTVLLVGIVLLFYVYNIQAVGKRVKEEFKKQKTFSFKVKRITEVANLLSSIYQVPVCVEEARWCFSNGVKNANTKKMLKERQEEEFTIKAKKNTLKEILDRFVIKYPEYRYEFDENNIVFNLLQKTNAITDNKIDVDIANSSIDEIMMRQDALGLKNLGIDANSRAFLANASWMIIKVLNIHGKGMRLYKVLNRIGRQLPQPRYWTIAERGKKSWSTFWDGTKRISKYDLLFDMFTPFDPLLDNTSSEDKKYI